MPVRLGAHSPRLVEARALLSPKGRRQQRRFLFEGATLLAEARKGGIALENVYATEEAYEATPLLADLEGDGTAVFLVDERSLKRLSDVTTATGLVAVAPQRPVPLGDLLARPGAAVLLAEVSDPGNVGTILRSADAFGAAGAIFERGGVEPYHPKVVRAAMGAVFRLPIALSDLETVLRGVKAAGRPLLGLGSDGVPVCQEPLPERAVFVVGQERRGLGSWRAHCDRVLAIPISQAADSLNAATAASIALYEASKCTDFE